MSRNSIIDPYTDAELIEALFLQDHKDHTVCWTGKHGIMYAAARRLIELLAEKEDE